MTLIPMSMKHRRLMLGFVRRHHPTVPKDPRTVLRTPRNTRSRNIPGGIYVHLGLRAGIQDAILKMDMRKVTTLNLVLNIDGLNLHRSSSKHLWPILGAITEGDQRKPFVVGVFWGPSKPTDVHAYLKDLIDELTIVTRDGFKIPESDRILPIRLSRIICDTPARAFVKQVKGHSGYFACERCVQKGHRQDRTMTFPRFNAPSRTDRTFRSRTNPGHHIGSSPFESLNINMIDCFPLDYMHLVCLGVTHQMLGLWVNSSRQTFTLTAASKSRISASILSLISYIPSEFQRKCRPLEVYDRWKATELRQFLLYLGPLVLLDVVSPSVYSNFMQLFLGIYLLSHPLLCLAYCDYANQLLAVFVQNFTTLYGEKQMAYNVHNLLHLASDVRLHGPLDRFSAFPFESFLGLLRGDVHGPTNPAAQIHRKVVERSLAATDFDEEAIETGNTQIGGIDEAGFHWGSVHLSAHSPNNAVIVDGHPGVIQSFTDFSVTYRRFSSVSPFFTDPLSSSKLLIMKACDLGPELHTTLLQNIKCKCCSFPLGEAFVYIPLLHSFSKL